MARPSPIDKELSFDKNSFIVSKTDLKGVIVYGNELFIKISGYLESELLNKPHSILRHPDMPRTIFKHLWDNIQKGEEVFAFVKNLSKDGSYYWVFAHITPSFDNRGNIIGYHSVRRKPTKEAIELIKTLYQEILVAEKSGGVEAGFAILNRFLETKGVSYDEFILSI